MVFVIFCGIGVGTGLTIVLFGLFPSPLTLKAALDRLTGDPGAQSLDLVNVSVGRLRRSCGHLIEANVARSPRLAASVAADLAITGTAVETFGVKVVGSTVALGLLGPVFWFALGAFGLHIGFEAPVITVVALATAGAAGSFFDLHTAAVRRRRHFGHALATYASLVSMSMSGAMGWSSALEAAAGISQTDWAISEIAQALRWSQVYRKQPWEGLDRLATRFALPDLADLARSMAQAGDGSRIRDTLSAMSRSLRSREATALEETAQAATQRMLLPGTLLFVGFLVLILYPALAGLTGSHL